MGLFKGCNKLVWLAVVPLFISYASLASQLPSTLEPSRIGTEIAEEPKVGQQILPTHLPREATAAHQPLPPEVAKITFQLNEILIIDPVIFSCEQLQEPYKKYLGQRVSLGQIQQMANEMTKKYQQAGYILTQVIIPVQRIKEGRVTLQVISGRVGKVEIIGEVSNAVKERLADYAAQIEAETGPLQMEVMERAMLLANDLPGLRVQAVLTPSKTKQGEADLTMLVTKQSRSAYVSMNNHGTRYLGPRQILVGIEENGIFGVGDSTQLQVLTTGNKHLNYAQLRHGVLINSDGMRCELFTRFVRDIPGATLAPFAIKGMNQVFGVAFSHPMLRSRVQNLTFISNFLLNDSKAELLKTPLYHDKIRPITAGFIYNLWDSLGGVNQLETTLTQGINLLGASRHGTLSRAMGRARFTKMNATVSRQQQLSQRWSFLALISGQYSVNSLLALSQFGYGGSFLGKGHDPSELLGDDGLGGTLEARYAPVMPYRAINTEFYTFFDAGRVWNKAVSSGPKRDAATSTGVGMRLQAQSHLEVNLYIAKPLSRKVSAVGNRPTRFFFSFTLRS